MSKSYRVKQVLIIRRDLKMTRGKEIAQAAHASMKVLLDQSSNEVFNGQRTTKIRHWPELTEWLYGSFAKIGLRVDSEQELLEIISRAKEANLPVAEIIDSGKTYFHGVPTLTCCAIGPAKSEEIDKITGHLRLL